MDASETSSPLSMTKKSLFHLTLQRLHRTGYLDASRLNNPDPSYFLDYIVYEKTTDTNEETRTTVDNDEQPPAITHPDENLLSKFWLEAHMLSCLENSSFESSLQQTLKNVFSSSSLSIENERNTNQNSERVNFVKKLLTRDDACAYIDNDGKILEPARVEDHYKLAIVSPPASISISSMSTNQLETLARITLASRHTDFSKSGQTNESSPEMSSRATCDQNSNNEMKSGGWFQYSASLAKKLTSGVNSAVDSLLNYYDGSGNDILASTPYDGVEASEIDEIDDAKCNLYFNDENADDDLLTRQGNMIWSVTNEGDSANFGPTDSLVSLSAVSLACRRILDTSIEDISQYYSDNRVDIDDYFFLNKQTGGMECIVFNRHGFDCGSFGSYCRRTGKQSSSREMQYPTTEYSNSIVRVLSNISESEVNLLALAFKQSGHAIIDENMISFFPTGAPSDFKLCKHNYALFQIHTSKLAVQNRMERLEKDAERVKTDAIRAKQHGLMSVAMVHMKRRKAVLEELDRCAAILANLDSSEIRLERAKTEVQYVQSFNLLKEALKDIRTMNDGKRVDDVENLMEEIQEDMDATNSFWNELGDAAGVVIDDVELQNEFQMLQLECHGGALDSNQVQNEEDKSAGILEAEGIEKAKVEAFDSSKTEAILM
mmetsp:Transcript_15959/g.33376  ORF Transcript_15959/g.33376 Transcript_15959/m.33376 type:complete len:660 (+) Transcript_15959:55-2034(+)